MAFSLVKKIEYRINNGSWTFYKDEGIELYNDGPVALEIKATDKVSNCSIETINTIIVDLIPPQTSFDYKGHYFKSGQRKLIAIDGQFPIELTAHDNLYSDYSSGLMETYYSINSIEYKYTGAFTIAEGEQYEFSYSSKDNVGNTEIREPVSIAIDNTPYQSKYGLLPR